jgi:hypothetical protein
MTDAGSPGDDRDADDVVPLFGTWPRIYAAVVLCAVVMMALIAVFSRWPYQ